MKNIETFLAVAETGSFTKAGERLSLTQPTVTKRIANMEVELKQRLFKRVGHKVFLTDAGISFLEHAKEIYQRWLKARYNLSEYSDKVIGTLSICCNINTGLYVLPKLIKIYKQKFPGVKLQLNFLHSPNVTDEILNQHSEIGFTTEPESLPSCLNSVLVKRDIHVPMANKRFLADTETSQLKVLSSLPALMSSPESVYYQIMQNFISSYAIQSEKIPHINMLETIKKMVEESIGWSILPRSMSDDVIVPLNINTKEIWVGTVCIYRNNIKLSRPVTELIELIKKVDINY